jgi:hypothetical protein
MKNLRQLCFAVVLTLVAATYTFAGDMHTLIADPPPPPSATEGQIQIVTAGEITTMESEAVVDPVAQVALSVLQSLMSLF